MAFSKSKMWYCVPVGKEKKWGFSEMTIDDFNRHGECLLKQNRKSRGGQTSVHISIFFFRTLARHTVTKTTTMSCVDDASSCYVLVRDASGRISVYTTKHMWSNASQTHLSKWFGLSDHDAPWRSLTLMFGAVDLWSDHPRGKLAPGVKTQMKPPTDDTPHPAERHQNIIVSVVVKVFPCPEMYYKVYTRPIIVI